MTILLYLTDSYQKILTTKVTSIKKKGTRFELELEKTIFYPEGGGQPSDVGEIIGPSGTFKVTHVRLSGSHVIHEGKLVGLIEKNETVTATIDWDLRYRNMRIHSAGHIIHEVVMETVPGLLPVKGVHGKQKFIEYIGHIHPKLLETIEKKTNMLIASSKPIATRMVSLEELKKTASWIPPKLPKNKPLRVLQIEGYKPIPDGGTQVKNTSEAGEVKIVRIEPLGERVRVHYQCADTYDLDYPARTTGKISGLQIETFLDQLKTVENQLLNEVNQIPASDIEKLHVTYFGSHGKATLLIKQLTQLPQDQKKHAGLWVNDFKNRINGIFKTLQNKSGSVSHWFDTSLPGILPPQGHLHIVSQAISEISRIFEKIGFSRVRHPEVDWDYYTFEALNMPPHHPARDEWETFFIENPDLKSHSRESGNLSRRYNEIPGQARNDMNKRMVLTPHTSNGQVREMEKGNLPIRMINIAKCYRRQSDVSHSPMFHQFEGMYIDKNVSIGNLKGVMDYFFKMYYGPERKSRLRPFHFQFTEPSFEVDVNCGICLGSGCKLCKDGWLELGGSGMVHPNVLRSGGIDPNIYSGFAFGWGVERVAMMRSGTQIDDVRLLYSNDVRFLEQF